MCTAFTRTIWHHWWSLNFQRWAQIFIVSEIQHWDLICEQSLLANEQRSMRCWVLPFAALFLNHSESFCSNKWSFSSLLMVHQQHGFGKKGASGMSSQSSSVPDSLFTDEFCIALHPAAGMCHQNQEMPTNIETPVKAEDTTLLWQVNSFSQEMRITIDLTTFSVNCKTHLSDLTLPH